MPYYGQARGDYSTYGYGRGDPGFLSSLWKGVKKLVIPAAATLIGGPIAGGIVRAGMGGGGRTPPIMGQRSQPRQELGVAVGPMRLKSTDFYPPVPQFTGAAMGRPRMTPGFAGAMEGTGCCPRGYHMAKDGSGKCVRNRRMNVANPRALRRSMRRVQGFEKLARRTISFTKRVRMKK